MFYINRSTRLENNTVKVQPLECPKGFISASGLYITFLKKRKVSMRKAAFTRCFFTGLLLVAFITGCSETHNRTSTGEYTDDASISDEVRAGLFDDPAMRGFQIKVESFKGFVQLSGFVDSAESSGRATQIAKSVRGVQYVKNSILIKE